jgi:hypothetical protein
MTRRIAHAAQIGALVLALAVVPAALAAKSGTSGGGRHGGGGGTTGSSSLSLVLLNSTDGLPHYGQQVTFNVSTSATTEPYVRLDCYEGGVWVLSSSAGFFASYPWPWARNFTLSWDMWHSPGAESDCTATLYNGGTTYAALKFHVYA